MTFLQLFPSYGEYLADFTARFPEAASRDYAGHKQLLIEDGFGIVHMVARYLPSAGLDCDIVFTECEPLQRKWLAERGETLVDPANWRHEIAARQVNAARPDVLYVTEPVFYDRRFLDRLDYRPRLVMGWKAATIPPETDWTGYDLILSNFRLSFEIGPKIGARRVETFTPGFPPSLAAEFPEEGKTWDVSFLGSISSEHRTRTDYLNHLARSQLVRENDFSLGYFLRTAEPDIVPVGIAMHNQGPRWGREMHRILKNSRIALNVGVDHAKGETGNMRMLEATGLGTFLLTEYQDNIRRYFEPGVDVETFASPGELVEKVRHYLQHPEEREAIARRGHARCVEAFSMERSIGRLAELIRANAIAGM